MFCATSSASPAKPLASGGHNAGIISEPGHRNRRYRIATRPAGGQWHAASEWLASAQQREGSWWPAWQQWLAARSGPPIPAKPIPAQDALGDAPGAYVLKHYAAE
jgi:polyhydroxyalkanoate synthase